jgi:hypothetical protein
MLAIDHATDPNQKVEIWVQAQELWLFVAGACHLLRA